MPTAPAAPVPAKQPAVKPAYTVRNLLIDKQADIGAALPKHIGGPYFMRVVLTCIQRNPKLAECTTTSLLGSILQCAQLGLVPDGFLGQAYLIPYENRKKQVLEVQFQVGYRGLVTLARRSGEISSLGADVVHARDTFKQVRGIQPNVEHTPYEGDEDPGELTHVYAWYRLKDGGYDLSVLNRRQVYAIREHSQAYQTGMKTGRKDSPWFTHPDWMWKKTDIKQLLKLAPLSVEIQRAAALDDAAEAGLPQDLALLADPTAEPTALLDGDTVDEETGEVIEMPQRASTSAEVPPVASRAAPTAPAAATTNGTFTDRIVDAGPVQNGWAAHTESGLKVWTRDAELGGKLVAAKGQLRRCTADPADAQGRRRLTALEA